MTKFSRITVVLAVMALAGLSAVSASAAEWHTNGDLAFTSTDAGEVRATLHSPTTQSALQCASSRVSGTLNGPTSTALPWLNAATVTLSFGTTCSIIGVPGYTLACSSGELRADSYAGGTTLATAGGGVTTGRLTSIDCRFSAGATPCSTITGTVAAHYINPNPVGTGAGSLTITAAGQSLTMSKIGVGCAAFPNGNATFGKPGPGTTITNLTYLIDGPNAPLIYRTP